MVGFAAGALFWHTIARAPEPAHPDRGEHLASAVMMTASIDVAKRTDRLPAGDPEVTVATGQNCVALVLDRTGPLTRVSPCDSAQPTEVERGPLQRQDALVLPTRYTGESKGDAAPR